VGLTAHIYGRRTVIDVMLCKKNYGPTHRCTMVQWWRLFTVK